MNFTKTCTALLLLTAAAGFGCSNAHTLDRDSAVPGDDSGEEGPDGGIVVPDTGLARPDADLVDAFVGDARVADAGFDGVPCGDAICIGDEECFYDVDPSILQRCVPPSFRTAYEYAEGAFFLGCDGPEDCTADQVCVFWPGSVGYWTECGDPPGYEELCHSLADCPPGASACAPSRDLADIDVCQSSP